MARSGHTRMREKTIKLHRLQPHPAGDNRIAAPRCVSRLTGLVECLRSGGPGRKQGHGHAIPFRPSRIRKSWFSIEDVIANSSRAHELFGPARAHRNGVVVGRPVDQDARPALDHGPGDLAKLLEGFEIANTLYLAVAEGRELAPLELILALVHHGADRVWIGWTVDPIQNHVGDGDLTNAVLAPGLEIQRLGQAAPLFGAFADPDAVDLVHVDRPAPFGGQRNGGGRLCVLSIQRFNGRG